MEWAYIILHHILDSLFDFLTPGIRHAGRLLLLLHRPLELVEGGSLVGNVLLQPLGLLSLPVLHKLVLVGPAGQSVLTRKGGKVYFSRLLKASPDAPTAPAEPGASAYVRTWPLTAELVCRRAFLANMIQLKLDLSNTYQTDVVDDFTMDGRQRSSTPQNAGSSANLALACLTAREWSMTEARKVLIKEISRIM